MAVASSMVPIASSCASWRCSHCCGLANGALGDALHQRLQDLAGSLGVGEEGHQGCAIEGDAAALLGHGAATTVQVSVQSVQKVRHF